MALKNCPECNREISDKAPVCPHCGYPLDAASSPARESAPNPNEFNWNRFLGGPAKQTSPGGHPSAPPASAPKKIGCGTLFGVILLLAIISGSIKKCDKPRTTQSATSTLPADSSMGMPQAETEAILDAMRTSLEAKEYQKVLEEGQKFNPYWNAEAKRMEGKARTNLAVLRIAELEKVQGGSEAERLERYTELVDSYRVLIQGEHTPEEEAALKKWNALRKPLREKQLIVQVRKLPASDLQGNFSSYAELVELNPDKTEYRTKRDAYRRKLDRQTALADCDIEVLSWHWSSEYGHTIAEGRVKNHTGLRLENIVALVEYNDGNGELITSDSALIEYNPLMPGQTSPFKVITRYNPQMRTAGIRFRMLGGGEMKTAYPEK